MPLKPYMYLYFVDRGNPSFAFQGPCIMQDFDTTLGESEAQACEREQLRQRVWEFLTRLLKKIILFVSFGTGVLGLLWLLGRIFKR